MAKKIKALLVVLVVWSAVVAAIVYLPCALSPASFMCEVSNKVGAGLGRTLIYILPASIAGAGAQLLVAKYLVKKKESQTGDEK